MDNSSPSHEPVIRLTAFFGILLVMALWEWFAPRRPLTVRKGLRWSSNLLLMVLNSLAQRLLIPLTAVGCAQLVQQKQWGLLHQVQWAPWLEGLIAILLLDLIIYFQHVVSHRVPLFWRFHKVHHADLDLDVTSGVRFHTIEILASTLLKLVSILALGPAPLSVLIFEIVLNGMAMFNHSNVRMPLPVDHWLRWFVVTPDMHRVHHSVVRGETNSNYGFNVPWWDYLFRTYTPQPEAGHEGMTIGLEEYREVRDTSRLDRMWLIPWFPSRRSPDSRLAP